MPKATPRTAQGTIAAELRSFMRRQGSELSTADIGRQLGEGFGKVYPEDVGIRVWLRPHGLEMESRAQRSSRKAAALIRKNEVAA